MAMKPLSNEARNVKSCPFCKELIAGGATICSHCGSNVVVPKAKKKRPFLFRDFMLGVYVATAFWLYLIIKYFR
jgi:hypothetical protein